jgi:hypothetical protein
MKPGHFDTSALRRSSGDDDAGAEEACYGARLYPALQDRCPDGFRDWSVVPARYRTNDCFQKPSSYEEAELVGRAPEATHALKARPIRADRVLNYERAAASAFLRVEAWYGDQTNWRQ